MLSSLHSSGSLMGLMRRRRKLPRILTGPSSLSSLSYISSSLSPIGLSVFSTCHRFVDTCTSTKRHSKSNPSISRWTKLQYQIPPSKWTTIENKREINKDIVEMDKEIKITNNYQYLSRVKNNVLIMEYLPPQTINYLLHSFLVFCWYLRILCFQYFSIKLWMVNGPFVWTNSFFLV